MNTAQEIPLLNLAVAFIPALVTVGIMARWSLGSRTALYAIARMLLQLLLIGYCLDFIFRTESSWIVLAILTVMVAASSWIALRTVAHRRRQLLVSALASILVGGGLTLLLITQGVLNIDPWYTPSILVPLAGMSFANAMNSVSLAAERMDSELRRDVEYEQARMIAMQACLIPFVNSMFAVGLVALPGMMTGQILSGTSPLIAVRYQIMAMCLIFGSAGMSAALFLQLGKKGFLHCTKP